MALYTAEADTHKASVAMQRLRLPPVLTSFNEVEFANALQLRVFRKEAATHEAEAAWLRFHQDRQDGLFIMREMTAEFFAQAVRLAQIYTAQFGVRTLDILHVATALECRADAFWTFDYRQAGLAKAVGLKLLF